MELIRSCGHISIQTFSINVVKQTTEVSEDGKLFECLAAAKLSLISESNAAYISMNGPLNAQDSLKILHWLHAQLALTADQHLQFPLSQIHQLKVCFKCNAFLILFITIIYNS